MTSRKIFQINKELPAHPKIISSFHPVIGFDLIPSRDARFPP